MSVAAGSRRFELPAFWVLALILGATLFCYGPSLRGGFLWDDQAHVTAPDLRSLAGLGRIWTDVHATQQYYPVLHSAFWLEHRLWGDATLGYHLVNALWHAIAAGLLFSLLRGWEVRGAALAALIFAVHPVAAESVAWISEQKNTLSLVFYLLAATMWARFDARRGTPGNAANYALASLLFLLALLTKSVTATLPAALLVVRWWRAGRIEWRRDVVPLLPWFVAALAAGLFTAWVERAIIGADGAQFDLTPLQRVALAGRIVWFYLGKLFWPARLMFFYPRWDVPAAMGLGLVAVVGALAVTVALWRQRIRAPGPLAAWLFFVGSLFPALGFFNVYPFRHSYVADHFQYLASLGVVTAVAAGLARWTTLGRVLAAAPLALVVVLALLSRAQSRNYTDARTLYRETLRLNPDCWVAHNNLGSELLASGLAAERPEAIAHFEAALRTRPDYAEAHYNLANALLESGRPPTDAIAHYETAIRLRPDYVEAHNNLGNALARIPARLPDAVKAYEATLRLRPDFAAAHFNLGNVLLKLPGRRADAIAEFTTVLRLQPDHFGAHRNLGFIWSPLPARRNDAMAEYRAAMRLKPGDAGIHYDLANVLQQMPAGVDEAIGQFREAIRLQPSHAEAHNNLGGLLVRQPGHEPEAKEHFEAALQAKPDYAEAHYNLGALLIRLPGQRDAATRHLDEFVRLWPNKAEAQMLVRQLGSAAP